MKLPGSQLTADSDAPADRERKADDTPSPPEIGLEQTLASAISLPPLELDLGGGLAKNQPDQPGQPGQPAPGSPGSPGSPGILPPVSESIKRLSETPPEALESLRRSRPPPFSEDELV